MAAPNYKELVSISHGSEFQDRCTIAVSLFARYIINTEAPNVTGNSLRVNWAKSAILNPAGIVGQLRDLVILDPLFANATSPLDINTITDAQLQAAVEAAINATALKF